MIMPPVNGGAGIPDIGDIGGLLGITATEHVPSIIANNSLCGRVIGRRPLNLSQFVIS
jgi:hypothetical protein